MSNTLNVTEIIELPEISGNWKFWIFWNLCERWKYIDHSMLNFGRTIFPGVREQTFEAVMRHGSQASDEIEDDLYQYNVE